jgi:hypothetical protein
MEAMNNRMNVMNNKIGAIATEKIQRPTKGM